MVNISKKQFLKKDPAILCQELGTPVLWLIVNKSLDCEEKYLTTENEHMENGSPAECVPLVNGKKKSLCV